jgi:hypothetical protein
MILALTLGIAWMVWAIGYSLAISAVMYLHRENPADIRATDFIILLLWPIMVPVVLTLLVEGTVARAREANSPL